MDVYSLDVVKARFYDEERYQKGDLERKGPTRFLLLTNLVGRDEVDEDLEWETAEEASRFGRVLRCSVIVVPDVDEYEAVRVLIEYESASSAAKAFTELHEHMIGGREVKVRYIEEGSVSLELVQGGSGKSSICLKEAAEGAPAAQTPADGTENSRAVVKESVQCAAPAQQAAEDSIPANRQLDIVRDNETGLWVL